MTAAKHCSSTSHGFTLIEVLVTLVIMAVGLMGLAGLQMTSLNSQFESYQRAQALLLVEDMSNRLRANTVAARAGAYPEGAAYGLGTDEDCTTLTVTAERDLCEWNDAVAGVNVVEGGRNLGSAMGARGCIESIAGSADGEAIIRLTVAWQGMAASASPVSTCGLNAFGDDDAFRRTVTIDTVLANMAI
jgi:type IV pilus assembly protein PilV